MTVKDRVQAVKSVLPLIRRDAPSWCTDAVQDLLDALDRICFTCPYWTEEEGE